MFKSQLPSNWKDLQNDVSEFFSEMGYNSQTPYMCINDSISFEIDVYAEKIVSGINIKILIECKYWESDVPQDVVFSMITRVNKFGANIGIIITKNGFQKGAISSVKDTNILLFSYDDFLNHFVSEWMNLRLNSTYNKIKFFDNIMWDCYLEREESKGENSDFLNQYGYLLFLYTNMKSGKCISYENYSNEGFLNHIPKIVISPNGTKYEVNVLGDAFRLFLNTEFLNQINHLVTI